MNVIHSSTPSLPKAEEKTKSTALFNLYNDIPQFELTLDEFEVYALKRLKVRKVNRLAERILCDKLKPARWRACRGC